MLYVLVMHSEMKMKLKLSEPKIIYMVALVKIKEFVIRPTLREYPIWNKNGMFSKNSKLIINKYKYIFFSKYDINVWLYMSR